MRYVFTPERVCSKKFMIDVDEDSRTIREFQFEGGCPGNLNGIARLLVGMKMDDVITRLENMPICPSSKVTSCPEQLRKALLEMREHLDSGTVQERKPLGLDSFAGFARR